MFQFAWPWLLLCFFMPWVIRFFLKPAPSTMHNALKIPFFSDVLSLSSSNRKAYNFHIKYWLIYLIWLLLLIAASGPQWLNKPIEIPRQGRDIMLAVDLSHSMHTPDMALNGYEVDRLTVVKHIANQFIEQRKGDQLGLILFGSRAYLQTPLTFDRKTVQHMLQDSSIGLAGPQTAIGDAIGLAIKRLRKQPKDSRVLVLLTDGVNTAGSVSPQAAADIAAKNGIRIYTIGIGSDHGIVGSFFGNALLNPGMDLDEKTLNEIAHRTNGMYFRAKDSDALARAYKTINKLEPVKAKSTTLRMIKPLYPWPLGLALILFLLLLLSRVFHYARS